MVLGLLLVVTRVVQKAYLLPEHSPWEWRASGESGDKGVSRGRLVPGSHDWHKWVSKGWPDLVLNGGQESS